MLWIIHDHAGDEQFAALLYVLKQRRLMFKLGAIGYYAALTPQ
jgi:hypothetical protein